MPFDMITIMVISLAIFIMGFSKAGLGGGLGAMTTPVALMVLDPAMAIASILPVLCLLDIWIMRTYWSYCDRRLLKFIIPISLLGMLLGMLTFQYLSVDLIRLMLGMVTILFALNYYLKLAARAKTSQVPSRFFGGICSAAAGFTTFVAHAGGPPLSMYLLPMRLAPKVMIATFGGFVAVNNVIKIVPYYYLDFFSASSLFLSVIMLPAAIIGVLSGFLLIKYLREAWFYNICYACMLLMGVKLIYDGSVGMFL